jgi:hypothetical protein
VTTSGPEDAFGHHARRGAARHRCVGFGEQSDRVFRGAGARRVKRKEDGAGAISAGREPILAAGKQEPLRERVEDAARVTEALGHLVKHVPVSPRG